MRKYPLTALVALSLGLAGCTSMNEPDGPFAGVTSNEVTHSVRPSSPVPQGMVGQPAPITQQNTQQELEWGGPLPMEGPTAMAGSRSHSVVPLAAHPSVEPIALVRPESRPIDSVAIPSPSNPNINGAARSRIYRANFSDAKPINFGKVQPKHYEVHGVDVSRWQTDMDWARVRSRGGNFAFIKATDGGDHLDPMFKKNWQRTKAAGIPRGAYHFFYWCRNASSQADWFIRNVPREPDALPPVIDVEYNGQSSCKMRLSTAQVREKMQVFMDRLERHYGQKPIIYTAPDFYKDHLQGAFLDYPFWLRAVAQHPSRVYPSRKWVFWQYSGSGLSQGVDGKIDLNVFNGTEAGWHKWLKQNTRG